MKVTKLYKGAVEITALYRQTVNLLAPVVEFVLTVFRASVTADGGTLLAALEAQYTANFGKVTTGANMVMVGGASKVSKIYGINPTNEAIVAITVARNSTATYVGSDGLIKTAAINMPRLDYHPITLAIRGYLFELAGTNLFWHSSAFNNTASWMSNAITFVTTGTPLGPDGVTLSTKIVETAGANFRAITQDRGYVNGTVYTYSIFAKAGERSIIHIFTGLEGIGVAFNLATGQMSLVHQLAIGQMIAYPNGWYRCSMTYTMTRAGSTADIYMQNVAGENNYTGNGTSGLYLWGAMLQTGMDLTSYIPTTTANGVRQADTVSYTAAASGSLFTEVNGVKAVTAISAGTVNVPKGTVKSLTGFSRTLTSGEITTLTT